MSAGVTCRPFQATVGLLVGLFASGAAGRVMQSLLFEVAPGDPVTTMAVVLTLTLVAAAGTWLPVRRATRVEGAAGRMMRPAHRPA